MDSGAIIAAVIGGVATVLAAVLPIYCNDCWKKREDGTTYIIINNHTELRQLRQRKRKRKRRPTSKSQAVLPIYCKYIYSIILKYKDCLKKREDGTSSGNESDHNIHHPLLRSTSWENLSTGNDRSTDSGLDQPLLRSTSSEDTAGGNSSRGGDRSTDRREGTTPQSTDPVPINVAEPTSQSQEGQQIPAPTPSVVKGVYWFSYSGMGAADIDATLYTHIFCAFAELDHNTNEVTISNGINAPHISSFTSTFQRINPSVSTILSIEEGNYSTMASSYTSRQSFINSAIQLARNNNFCGLDINWQYPEGTGMANYDTLLTELRTAVNAEAISSGRAPLLLTAVLYFSARRERETFPVESIKTNLDWINLMTYDYHGPSWEPRVTAAPAALYDQNSVYNTESGIDCWIDMGLPPNKIALGLPSYGRAWKLKEVISNIDEPGVGVDAEGPAVGNEFEPNGAIAYIDIKNFIKKKKATTHFDRAVVSNYCYAGKTWIGYDDVESVEAKVFFAEDKGLLGYIFWSVSEDDENFSLSRKASTAMHRDRG